MCSAGLIVLILGLFTILKNRKAIGSFAFLTLSIVFSIWLFGISVVYLSRVPETALFWTRFFWSGVVYIGSAIYFFSQTILENLSKTKKAVALGFIVSTGFLISLHTTDLLISGVNHYFWGYYAKAGPMVWPFFAFFFWQLIASLQAYYKRYKEEKIPVIKKQIGVVLISFLVVYTASVDFLPAIGFNIYPFGYIPMFGFVCVLFYAMAKYRLLDIRTVFHKTIMWFVTSTVLLVPVLWGVLKFRQLFMMSTDTQFITVIVSAFILFFFYIRYIQPHIDNLFQRKIYSAQNVLDEFIASLGALNTLNALIDSLVQMARRVLYTNKVSVYVLSQENNKFNRCYASSNTDCPENISIKDEFLKTLLSINMVMECSRIHDRNLTIPIHDAQDYFDKVHAQVCVPFIHNNELIAFLNLGEKINLKQYSALDLNLLEKLKIQMSIALSNALIYGTLERKVEERTVELKAANHQLQQLDEAKTRFFANVSHELRTPLALIQGPLVKFYQEEPDEQKRKQFALCIRNVHRLLNEVNDLLDFAKLESGRMMLAVSPVELATMVEELVEVMSPGGGVRPVLVRKEDVPVVYLERGKLEKVFSNLMINAIKFSRESGCDIEVSVYRYDDAHAAVTVRDHGQGIDAVQLPHIFERFYQGDEKMVRGTGLGLTMVKEYVELHKGQVVVESEKGKGTAFTVVLPLGREWFAGLDYVSEKTGDVIPPISQGSEIDRQALHSAARSNMGKFASIAAAAKSFDTVSVDHDQIGRPEAQLALPLGAKKILIVDDEIDMGVYIKSILQDKYQIRTVYNGKEGLQMTSEFRPDLILSDVMMPEMNGYEMARAVRADAEISDTPIILLTANAAHESLLESFRHGANDYLSKPFHVDELILRVENQLKLISQKRQLKDAYEKLKSAESELVHAQKLSAVGTLSAGVAHHLNNALFSMVGEIESIEFLAKDVAEGKVDPKQVCEELKRSHAVLNMAHDRAKRIVESLLNFSSTNRPKERDININHELEDTLVLYEIPANREVRFHRQFGVVSRVHCFASDITHAVMSVFQNAVSALKDKGGGNVWIETREEMDDVVVAIRNDGPMIPVDVRQKIFEPFFSTKEVDKGDGLGLAIAVRALERQGGCIRLTRSDAESTEFEIRIKKHRSFSAAAAS